MTPEQLAITFHETYEQLAPQFGYETRTETRRFDPATPNGKLMIAVCGKILAQPEASLIAAAPELLEACKTFAEWLRREDEGFVKAGHTRNTPEDELAWQQWYYENLRICALAQKQATDAIAKAEG